MDELELQELPNTRLSLLDVKVVSASTLQPLKYSSHPKIELFLQEGGPCVIALSHNYSSHLRLVYFLNLFNVKVVSVSTPSIFLVIIQSKDLPS